MNAPNNDQASSEPIWTFEEAWNYHMPLIMDEMARIEGDLENHIGPEPVSFMPDGSIRIPEGWEFDGSQLRPTGEYVNGAPTYWVTPLTEEEEASRIRQQAACIACIMAGTRSSDCCLRIWSTD